MVDNQVDVTEQNIKESFVEQAFVVSGSLADFAGLDIEPTRDTVVGGTIIERGYNFIVETSGIAGTVNVDTHNRSVIVGTNPPSTPQLETSFFTSMPNVAAAELHVHLRENRDALITYDIFHTAPTTGALTYDLTIVTVEFLPGVFSAVLPVTVNAPILVKAVLREVKGVIRVYDYFILSEQ